MEGSRGEGGIDGRDVGENECPLTVMFCLMTQVLFLVLFHDVISMFHHEYFCFSMIVIYHTNFNQLHFKFYYDYTSDTSDISNINSDIHFLTLTYSLTVTPISQSSLLSLPYSYSHHLASLHS